MTIVTLTPHSFDTVSLVIPCLDANIDTAFLLARISASLSPDGSPRSEWVRHYFARPDQFKDAPSWWSPPMIEIEGWKIRFSFSLPKLFYGHSARHASDLGLVLQGLEDYMRYEIQVPPAVSWPDWQLSRIDLCYNFSLPSPEHAKAAEQQLSRLRYRGRLALRDKRAQYPYWPSTTRTVKFYIKGLEMLKHQKEGHYPEGWLEARRYRLDSILRYEEEWRGKQLERFVGVELADQVTVGKFLQRMARWSVDEHIAWIQKQFLARGPQISIQETLSTLHQGLRKPGPAMRFAMRVLDEGLEAVRLSMAKPTYYRCCASLRRLGIEPAMLESHWENRFAKPVDISHWVCRENFCTDFDREAICEDPLYNRIMAHARAFAGKFYEL